MQRQRQRRLDPPQRQPLEHAPVADRREDQVLVPDVALAAEQSIASRTLSRLWAGSPMPMNTTFLTTRSERASATCATISALPSWRARPSRPVMQNDAAHRAADLGRDAQAVARQQHGLDRLAVGQLDQQAREPSAPSCSERRRARPPARPPAPATRRAARAEGNPRPAAGRCPAAAPASTRAARCRSWQGLAPRARSRWRRCSRCMAGRRRRSGLGNAPGASMLRDAGARPRSCAPGGIFGARTARSAGAPNNIGIPGGRNGTVRTHRPVAGRGPRRRGRRRGSADAATERRDRGDAGCARQALKELPFSDKQDFEDARRGFVAALPDEIIRAADGRAVFDLTKYYFIRDREEAPLDRQSRACGGRRGSTSSPGCSRCATASTRCAATTSSNMTIIEGDDGLIVIDPLISAETAKAALELYYKHRPRKPVVAVIYTHSHVDHFGGVRGVVNEADVAAGQGRDHRARRLPRARDQRERDRRQRDEPPGDLHVRRVLPPGPTGGVDGGLGQTTPSGTVTLIAPTRRDHQDRARSSRSTACGWCSSSRRAPRRRPR